jgi:hypothetical protein
MILTLARGVESRQSHIMVLYEAEALSLLIMSISSPIIHHYCLVRHYGFVFLDGMQAGRDELVEKVEFKVACHDVISKCVSIGGWK